MTRYSLSDLIDRVKYKPGWSFTLGWDLGCPTLKISLQIPDNYMPGVNFGTAHLMKIPATVLNGDWSKWLIDQIVLAEQHETCEIFMIGDERPFEPTHGPGGNLYPLERINSCPG